MTALRLSPKAYARLLTGKATAGNKYRAQKTDVAGKTFHSGLEARMYQELCMRESAGEILNVECQRSFPLVVNGIQVAEYRADFVFDERVQGVWVKRVVDTKSEVTRTNADYRIKKKLMLALFKIDIIEVLAVRKSGRKRPNKARH